MVRGKNDGGLIMRRFKFYLLVGVSMLLIPCFVSAQLRQNVEHTIEIIKHRNQYPNYVLVSAHRGYWADYPENSINAYRMAIEIGADIVEMDVRLTKDNELVVFHDACLDRVTTGYGKLREEDWSYVNSLYLKKEDGTVTTSKMLALSEAFDYLKDKAVIAVDIKEVGAEFTDTIIRVLRLLKSKRMLWQTIVKGKMRLRDLQDNVLRPAALTLDDFIYTPIAFSTTADLSTYISEFVNTHKIYAMELVYKQSADPILNYLEDVQNAGIWIGQYSFWPETGEGVIAEKVPLTDTDPIIRKYDFKDKDPNNFLDDGRGDWDWLFRHGADYVITDRSELLIEYLTKCGRRVK